MKNCIFRPARDGDLVDIIYIWTSAFGDEPEFPRRLLLDCGLLKNALVAETDGRVVSSLLLYHGLKLGHYDAAYLYALCTHPEYTGRGIGSALTACAAELARNRGSQLLLLQPGDEQLEQWYARQGFRVLWRSRYESLDIKGISAPAAEEISADEFLRCRRGSLVATPELIFSQEALNRVYRGAFLRVEKSLLCAEFDGLILHIRYANCDNAGLPHAGAATARYFGAEHVFRLHRDDETGSTALMYLPLAGEISPLPDGLFFPFTLD